MKIPSRLIIKVAMQLLEEQGQIVHIELHERIEEILGRQLTVNDKRRITQILNRDFVQKKAEKDRETYEIIRIFTL
ncbi:hypothetical protein ABOONEI_2476 [Aciduliprofundum boonei T469]|nr:hypothetical protein ABOONEI_2476 [Aciduliprofundum boonei T469]